MKIGIISTWHPNTFSGGVEVYISQLVQLLTHYYGPKTEVHYFTKDQLNIPRYLHPFREYYSSYVLGKRTSEASLDLVISHGHYGWRYWGKAPHLHVYHLTTPGYTKALGKHVSLKTKINAKLLGKLEKASGKQATQCISVSKLVAQEVQTMYGVNSHIVANFSALPTHTAITKTRDPLRAIFVGTWELRKGTHLLLPIVTALPNIHFELVIGGQTRPNDADVSTLQSQPNVTCHFCLPHDDVLSLYRDTDVLLFPSYYEGFGLVLTEALAHSVIPLCPPVGEGPRLFKHLKLPEKLLIQDNHPQSYIDALQAINNATNPQRQQWQKACYAVFLAHYTQERWQKQMCSILESLCKKV